MLIATPLRVSFAPAMPSTPMSKRVEFTSKPEEVWAEAGDVFGSQVAASLQASKWDRRVEALKAATTAVKGKCPQGGRSLRLQERVRAWRVACKVLNVVMRDKVMPVRLASHEAFLDIFRNADGLVGCGLSPEELHFAIGALLQHVIDRLGDSNLRLHESARKCVLFSAEHPGLLGLGAVLERLKTYMVAARSADRAKVHAGVLDTVNFLLQHFPGHRTSSSDDCIEDEDEDFDGDVWTQHDVSPFIVAGMDDALGSRVRSSAVTLAVTVYATFGLEAMLPMLAGLRPAKQSLLRQKFDESEWDEPEPAGAEELALVADEPAEREMADLLVCGHAMRPLPLNFHEPAPVETREEELLMDGILEDAGAVFCNGGLPGMAPTSPRDLDDLGAFDLPLWRLEQIA